jgi:hypothetical protein
MGMALLEAFGLAEEVNIRALSPEEVFWLAEARKRKGCKLMRNQLTREEMDRVLELGRRCLAYKKENQR